MTIHHDKLAYGKLASATEELSEAQILEMLNLINEQQEEEQNSKTQAQTKENKNYNK